MATGCVISYVRKAPFAPLPSFALLLLLAAAAGAKPLKDSLLDDLLVWPKRSGNGAVFDDDVSTAGALDGGVNVFFENADEFATTKIIASGHSMTLECVVTTSGASSTIHWLHNGRRIVQDPSELSVVNEAAAYESDASEDDAESSGPDVKTVSRLHIGCVDRSKGGKYTCVADAPTVRRAISRRVVVTDDAAAGAAAVSDRQCRGAEHASSAVRIYMYKKSHDDIGGRTAQLFCRSAGSPRPRVQWYYAGGPRRVRLETGSKYEVLNNGDLLIRNLETDDFGDYVCEATNGLTRSSITTNVYVYA